MRKPIPRVRAEWLVITDRWQELLVISEPTHWVSHWDTHLSRSRRCGGRDCAFCAAGCEKQLRVVVLGIDAYGKEKLLELRERHREAFDRYDSMVGVKLRVKRAGAAKNSPVDCTVLGLEHAVPRDIARLVESFGLPPITLQPEATSAFQPDPSDASLEPHD